MKPLFIKKNGTVSKVSGIVMPASYPASRVTHESVSVTADGVKTYSQLLDELFALTDQTKITKDSCVTIGTEYHRLTDLRGANIDYAFAALNGQSVMVVRLKLKASDSKYEIAMPNYSDASANVPTSGAVITLYY